MNMADLARGEAAQDARKPSVTDELMRWLLRYPFLSAEDLAAALGYSVAQCYRSLAELRRQGLGDAVTVPALGMSRACLYHLTSEGVDRIAEREGVDPMVLARYFRADEQHLLALLVRAPALVAVQTLMRGMVTQAPVALASAHRPCRVTWSWVRDYRLIAATQDQADQADQPLSLILDAYLILQIAPADGVAPRQGSQQAGHPTPQPAAAALVTEVDGGHVLPAGSRQHMGWYGVLVLHDAGLMPERLMARRLRTLHMCREAPDRWAHSSAYPAFPPLLVLTPDAHRAQRCHLIARSVAAAAGLDPLRGGVLVLTAQTLAAPWRAGWHTFDGSANGRLADLLIPSAAEALPPMMGLRSSERGEASASALCCPILRPATHRDMPASPPTGGARLAGELPKRRQIIGRYNDRARQVTRRRHVGDCQGRARCNPHSREQLALAALNLGSRHMDTLRLLHDHPLLSPAELSAALAVAETSVARYLSCLRHEGLVSTITARPGTLGWSATTAVKFSQPSRSLGEWEPRRSQTACRVDQPDLTARDRYLLSDDGLRFLAAGARLRPRSLSHAETHLPTNATKQQAKRAALDGDLVLAYHGCVAGGDLATLPARPHLRTLLRYPAHTAGVYTFFGALLRAAEDRRQVGDVQQLLWWETGAACLRRYRYHGCWRNFRPDGAGEYRIGGVGGRGIPFWLEWDRGTMGLRDLHAKFTSYAEYVTSREWMHEGARALPHLLIVTADTAGETRVAQALDAASPPHTPLAVHIAVASALHVYGPLSSIWRQWTPGTPPGHVALGPSRPLFVGS